MNTEMREDGYEPATKADLRESISASNARFGSLEDRLDGHDRRFESIDGNLRRLSIGFARLEGDSTEMKSKIDLLLTVKEDIARFTTNLDRTMKYFESCMRKMDSQGSMLMEHEDRLTKLEPRPN